MSPINLRMAAFAAQLAIFVGHVPLCSMTRADEPPTVKSPLSPQESLKHFVLSDGLAIELVASEPQIVDPVAIRFDENGRMWVVEMRDYPDNTVTGENARSVLKVLDDRDDDGFYETAAVVADDLRFATGVQPWQGGVFVTMAGQVAYLKDTNGDDQADITETWYTGFSEKNQQLRANHPRLALDNHIYIANGLRGGEIVDAREPSAKPVSISGMDFRFDPLTRQFEPVSGVGQFGLTFDDYNNRFVCSNRNPAMHVVLEDRDLKKNPLVAVKAVSIDVAKAGAESRLFPVGKSWTTSNLHAGQFTAACGLDIFRGDALPEAFYGNIFVCDPTAHLVHQEVMKPSGVTFTSQPATPGKEFLGSPDEWFSPVNLELGPDGALYVVDMYRAVIEHPEWMPTELRQRPDLLEGIDRGRIYRVVKKDFKRPAPPRLAKLSAAQLVDALNHPNAWWRETAARLLLERQDKSIGPLLKTVAARAQAPSARIHALWLLAEFELLDDELLLDLLDDKDPRVVEQAIIVAGSRTSETGKLRDRIARLCEDVDARVRFQALLAATPVPPPPQHAADEWELDAMLIAAGDRGGDALAGMLKNPAALETNVRQPKAFVAELARLAAASPDKSQQTIALDALLKSDSFRASGLTTLLAEISRREGSLDAFQSRLADSAQQSLDESFHQALAAARDEQQSEGDRCEAIALILHTKEPAKALGQLALGDASQPVRLAAIAALTKLAGGDPWLPLLDGFSGETPAMQRAILDGLMANPDRIALVLDAIESGAVKPTEIDVARAKLLLNHADGQVQQRAAKLLASAIPADRAKVLDEYHGALELKSDPARGQAVFQKNCATCHRIGDVGTPLAPDISDSRERTPVQLLTDIIQPNRAIDSNFFSYTAVTTDGLTHTGILTAETSTSVTLKQAEGKTITLSRDEIDDLHSDGVSFMPDGLEKNIQVQEMADLIAFIKNWRYLTELPNKAR